jgi:hypothetical protein
MPRSLTGTGGTRRDILLETMMNAVAKGHTVPLTGNKGLMANLQLTTPHEISTISHRRLGKRLIVCGDTKMGTDHVCGG